MSAALAAKSGSGLPDHDSILTQSIAKVGTREAAGVGCMAGNDPARRPGKTSQHSPLRQDAGKITSNRAEPLVAARYTVALSGG